MPYLETLNFHLVGYGCTTCIGNSGPLPDAVARCGDEGESGGGGGAERQSQFRRPHQSAGEGELSGVAAAGGGVRAGGTRGYRSGDRTAGTRTRTASRSTCATSGRPIEEVPDTMRASIDQRDVPSTNTRRRSRATRTGNRCPFPRAASTSGTTLPLTSRSRRTSTTWWTRRRRCRICTGMRVLALLGDSVTTDHISPAGSIPKDSPAGKYLIAQGVKPDGFQFLRRAARQP